MNILVVDDERMIRHSMQDVLTDEGYNVEVAEDGIQAIEKAKDATYDAIFLDIKMPQIDGIATFHKLRDMGVDVPILMMSGHADIPLAVDCMKMGAYDFLVKPVSLERLLTSARNALDKTAMMNQTKLLKKKVSKKYEMVGESESMQKLLEFIDKVAPTDARVLITGDNGTGKEVVAQQIYQKSKRSKAPFVEVNCAAIPSELIESELFGHEKGAFTSAIKTRAGKFEQANGGTIFLDEIGDMSLSAQAKVLRCLQENVISPVGSDKNIKIDVRVIAATNKNLADEIAKGNFREDLFHRLNVIPIHVPALNERVSDIPLLIEHFVAQICEEQGVAPKKFKADAIKLLQKRSWTGNIRELRNVVERLIILAGKEITATDVEQFA